MDKEIIDYIKNRLIEQPNILDIGFGTGRISFEIFSEITPREILGIESRKKEEIETDYNAFLGPEIDKGIYNLSPCWCSSPTSLRPIKYPSLSQARSLWYLWFQFSTESSFNKIISNKPLHSL